MQASIPRRHQEQHRDKAFRLAVPALLPHWDLGPCGDQGAGEGGRPSTLIIGWLVVRSIPLFRWWILRDSIINKMRNLFVEHLIHGLI
jgi:hypothetical protein